MKKYYSLIFVLFFLASNLLNAQSVKTGKEIVKYLSDDKLEGRYPGTDGDKKSIDFMVEKFQKFNLMPLCNNFVQEYEVQTDIKTGENSFANLNGEELELFKDYVPMTFSAETELSGNVIYVESENSVDSVNSTWVIVPIEKNKIGTHIREVIETAIVLNIKGAKGVVFVSLSDNNDFELLPYRYSRSVAAIGIPVVQITKDALVKVLNKSGFEGSSFDESCQKFINNNSKSIELKVNVETKHIVSKTANVAAYVNGENSDDWIVIGAHYDHLGYGGAGSGTRALESNEIHNGADDNASGVGMVLMLAEYYSKNKPESNIAFVLFGAEEQGLIGSKYFVRNLPEQITNIKMMINYDMVGRLRDRGLVIMGATTAEEFDAILMDYQSDKLPLTIGGGGFSGSDQASFYSEKVPVLFFSTGMHNDYHKPSDDIKLINFKGMKKIGKLSVKVIDDLSDPDLKLTYKDEKPQKSGRHGGKMKVKLGIMPDMTSRESDGVGVDGVTPGGVADISGIKTGDKIIELDGKEVTGIYEYMHIMSEFKPEQEIDAKVLREEKVVEIKIKF